MAGFLEFRFHGRGGQGGVTCAKIVAALHARLGRSVQTFGDYAGERSGAPVRAYTRVSDAPITNRNKVYTPDHLVVLDPTLLGGGVLDGLAPGGTLILNTASPLDAFDGELAEYRLAVVDATAIARRHGIGSRSLVIVNTTVAGAFCAAHDIAFDVLEETYAALGFVSNLDAAREAYDAVRVRDATVAAAAGRAEPAAAEPVQVEPLDAHLVSEPTGLATGTWGTQRPSYVENLAPCSAWCPAGNDVIGFVQAVAQDGEAAAATVLGRSTPLAGVCGRVCPAPCMEGCNRAEFDGSVNIRGLERWIADHEPVAVEEPAPCANPFHVAVVGGGPAGLSAAYTLAAAGHRVTIFEGEAQLGGVLRTGIPEFRLPRDVLDREIEGVLALGVEARCGMSLSSDSLRSLVDQHDAVIVATGLQRLRGLDVQGVDLGGVEQGIAYLHRVNVEGGGRMSGHVVVVGGGNTAIDCARSAQRAGAELVTIAYRRTRGDMPAIREEVEEAEDEGVRFVFQVQPIAFAGNGRVGEVELAEVELGEPDETGRRRPIVTERATSVPCDAVLLALGQSADASLMPEGWELREGRVFEHAEPLMVFAAGDFATGDGTVTHAIGTGRRAAGLALHALGADVSPFARPDRTAAVPLTDIRVDHFKRLPQSADPDASEADRCFSCGHCTRCDTCLVYCPEGIIRRQAPGYDVDYTYCKGCGICVEECPRSAMEMTNE